MERDSSSPLNKPCFLTANEFLKQDLLNNINENKRIMHEIFLNFYKSDSVLHTRFISQINDFKLVVTHYLAALEVETEFLCPNDHALRAAKALAALNDPNQQDKFSENLNKFNLIAQNSGFYPRLRTAGILLSEFSTISILCLIVPTLLILSGLVMPCSPAATLLMITGLAATAVMSYKHLPARLKQLNDQYSPVYNAKEKAKTLSMFFVSKPAKEAIFTQELNPIYVDL